jgi:hypothetical protein
MAVSVLLATDDAAGALAMASAFVPQVAALNLPMDGNIVELDLPPPYNDPAMNPFGAAFFVATDTSIGVGLGQNGETRLGELMGSPPGDPSTFLHTSVDMAAYYGLMADAMDNVGVLGAPGAPPMAFVSSISGMMRSMQDFYSRETVDVRFTERGIEIPVRLELAR